MNLLDISAGEPTVNFINRIIRKSRDPMQVQYQRRLVGFRSGLGP